MTTTTQTRAATPWHLVPGDEHDDRLVANVHPADWTNPQPAERYNLVVVGAGTAGLVCAAGAAGLGARVALVERSLMGGDCLNVGCVPSKGLLRAARAVADVRRAGTFGVRAGEPEIDFGAVMERMRRLRAGISAHDSARRFTELGVDVFLGEGRFVAPDAVEVAGARLRFSRAVVATGGRASSPAVPGLADLGFLTNENVFALTERPERLLVVGAGPIGCELAQAFARLGSRVTVVGRNPQVLPREDEDAAAIVARALTRDGVDLRLGATVVRVERSAQNARGARGGRGARRVVFERAGEEEAVEADAILVAAGRAPNVSGLGLEAAGVDFDPRTGVLVDDRLRTTNRRIYGCGDVAQRFQFTHAAEAGARLVIQNALFRLRKKASALVMPWCTFTDPEVAHVGLTGRDAAQRGGDVLTVTEPLGKVDRAILEGDDLGFVRLHLARKSGQVLGATMVAAHAGESVGELSLAITQGLRAADLDGTIHPYPTVADAIRRAGTAWQRTRLSPRVARVMKTWFRWTR